MRKWIGWLLVLAIAAMITTGGILVQRYLDMSASEMASRLEQVQQAVERGDWMDGRRSLAILEVDWSRTHGNWAMITDHAELDNLELSLVRLQKFIEARDEIDARVEVGEALYLIRNIPERERLTWQNVF
jgi:hypothetical protein